jgi:hypothetical protein
MPTSQGIGVNVHIKNTGIFDWDETSVIRKTGSYYPRTQCIRYLNDHEVVTCLGLSVGDNETL